MTINRFNRPLLIAITWLLFFFSGPFQPHWHDREQADSEKHQQLGSPHNASYMNLIDWSTILWCSSNEPPNLHCFGLSLVHAAHLTLWFPKLAGDPFQQSRIHAITWHPNVPPPSGETNFCTQLAPRGLSNRRQFQSDTVFHWSIMSSRTGPHQEEPAPNLVVKSLRHWYCLERIGEKDAWDCHIPQRWHLKHYRTPTLPDAAYGRYRWD